MVGLCCRSMFITRPTTANMERKNVLVVGANGYIGSAVCRAFVRKGWRAFGLIRRKEAAASLVANETIPIIGSLSDVNALENALFTHASTFDVIVGCTEPPDYVTHLQEAIGAIRSIAERSKLNDKVRPLVLWSSGCKDYGTTGIDGAPNLVPHTENSPLNPPAQMVSRAIHSLKMLEQTDVFDAAVLRPTNVYGHSSSYFGSMFEYAATAAVNGARVLHLPDVNPRSIMHASKCAQFQSKNVSELVPTPLFGNTKFAGLTSWLVHVDDCGEAYVALAEHPDRASVAGQCFNISASRYETGETILKALAEEYSFPEGTSFASDAGCAEAGHGMGILFGFSQWVGSDKIRGLTGWNDRRLLFSENIGVYRRSYEAAVKADDEDVARVKVQQEMWQ